MKGLGCWGFGFRAGTAQSLCRSQASLALGLLGINVMSHVYVPVYVYVYLYICGYRCRGMRRVCICMSVCQCMYFTYVCMYRVPPLRIPNYLKGRGLSK